MIDKDLLSILACPETHQPLAEADEVDRFEALLGGLACAAAGPQGRPAAACRKKKPALFPGKKLTPAALKQLRAAVPPRGRRPRSSRRAGEEARQAHGEGGQGARRGAEQRWRHERPRPCDPQAPGAAARPSSAVRSRREASGSSFLDELEAKYAKPAAKRPRKAAK